MSFTQRAKRKLVSLSKRKKLKHSEKEQTPFPPVQGSRFSISEDAHLNVSSSMSLPDQLNMSSSMSLPDQLNQSEPTHVSKISSKSLTSIETLSAGVTLLSYVSDATDRSRVFSRLPSSPALSSVPLKCNPTDIVTNGDGRDASGHSPSINLASAVLNSTDNISYQQITRKDNHFGKSSLLSRLGHSLDLGLHSRSSHVAFDEQHDYSLWTSRSPGEGLYSTNSNECQIPACMSSTNIRSCRKGTNENTEESQSVQGDLEISGEDSEASNDDVFKLDSEESLNTFQRDENLILISLSDTNITSSNNLHKRYNPGESEELDTAFEQTTKGHCTCKQSIDGSKIFLHDRAAGPKVSRSDSSIVKKIRFFEHYNEHRSKPANSRTNTKLLTDNLDGNPSVAVADIHTNNVPHKHIGNTSGDNGKDADDQAHCSGSLDHLKTAASYRVFPNSTSARQRLNFSRFKRSDSIPEDVALCSCGGVGPGGCEPDGHDGVINCQVCHHPQCTTDNDDMPLMLCSECDLEIHKTHDDHLVLNTRPAYDYIEEQTNHAPHIDADVSDSEDKLEVENTQNELDDCQQFESNKGDNTQIIQQELSNIMTLRNESYNLETANKHRAGSDGEIIALTRWTNAESSRNEDQKSVSLGRNSSLEESPIFSMGCRQDSIEAVAPGLTRTSSRGAKGVASDSNFTLRFGDFAGKEDECVVVAAAKNKSLRETLEPLLLARNLDVTFINVFVEKSQTPLPMSCDTSYLAGNRLEVKEKKIRVQQAKPLKKSESKRSERKLERSARRDSFGLATPPTEGPYSKQRRGSLQLPFREHFFTRSDSSHESPKTADDVSGSGRGFHRLTSIHTDEPTNPSLVASYSESRKSRPYRYPKLGSINKEKERQEHLTEILNKYSQNGLPQFPELLDLGRKKFDDSIFNMEPSWKMIVENHEALSKKQHEHQEAVWELLHTEVSYIRQIRVIIEVFQNCLMNIQLESFLNEIESERLFSNIDKIYECNCLFWQRHLLPILQASRESRLPLDPLLSKEGFVDHFPILFQVYFKYFIEHKSCLDYAKSCMDNNELFRTFVQWAETQKQCNRLKFSDILGQPMPRLLKYSLLLRAILKYTEKDNDRIDLKAMIQSVDKLCGAANNSLRRIEEYKRLEAVRKTLEPFDSIEVPNDECAKIIQGFVANFNLLAPMPGFQDGPRSLLFQSSLRLKEGQNVKMDVDCLLFTDLLLICKSNRKMERFKMIRPPMRLDHLVMSVLKDRNSFLLIYMNEYNVPLSAFTLHSDPGSIRGWVEKFREAQREFKAKDIQKNSEMDRLRSDMTLTQSDLDDMSMSSALSYIDIITSTISHSDSSNSLDHFVPNVLPVNGASADMNQSEVAHSNSMPNFKNFASSISSESHGQNSSAEVKLVLSSSTHPFNQDADMEVIGINPAKQTPTHLVSMSADQNSNTDLSVNAICSELINQVTTSDKSNRFQEVAGEGRPTSQTYSGKLDPHVTIYDQKNSTGQETPNTKLNSRRTEKRYHTADEIPDILNSQRDPGIQKWSSLRKDFQLSDLQDLGSTVLSSDSFQSYQSSSGVSSNGSLHLMVEISGGNDSASGGDVFISSPPTEVDRLKQLSVDDSRDVSKVIDFTDGGSTRSYLSEPRLYLADSRHAKSKSTSDLVEMCGSGLQVSQMTDGIASVAVTPENFYKKLTQLDVVRLKEMKHQLLTDANVESSEV